MCRILNYDTWKQSAVVRDKKTTFAADDILITTVFINHIDETVIVDANKHVQRDTV